MKMLILNILIVFSLKSFCQDLKYPSDYKTKIESFKEELYNFMYEIKLEYRNSNDQVYVIYVYPYDSKCNNVEYTVGYIKEWHKYEILDKSYYVNDTTNRIIVIFDEKVKNRKLPDLKIYPMNDLTKNYILQRLTGGYVLAEKGYKGFIFNEIKNKRFLQKYENSYLMPYEKSIYKFFNNAH